MNKPDPLESNPKLIEDLERGVDIIRKKGAGGMAPACSVCGIEVTTYQQIIEAIDDAEADEKIKTIQLNINSPGGELNKYKEAKDE